VAAVVAMQEWQSRMFGIHHSQDVAATAAPAMMELFSKFDKNLREENTLHGVRRNPPTAADLVRFDVDSRHVARSPTPPRIVPSKKRLFDVESLLAPDTPKSHSIEHHCDVTRNVNGQHQQLSGGRITPPAVCNKEESSAYKKGIRTHSPPVGQHDVIVDNKSQSNNDAGCSIDDDDDNTGVDVEEITYEASDNARKVTTDAIVAHPLKQVTEKQFPPHGGYSAAFRHQPLQWGSVCQPSLFSPPSSYLCAPICGTGPQPRSWMGVASGRHARYSPVMRSSLPAVNPLRLTPFAPRSADSKSSSDVYVGENEGGDKCKYFSRTIKLETS